MLVKQSLVFFLTIVFFATTLLSNESFDIVAPVYLTEAPYAEWAHYHMIWLGNKGDTETQANLVQLVNDYLAHSIPVGAINVDSSWPQNYQNFKWNEKKFPNPKEMIDHLHALNINVICWITSTINNESSNYAEAKANGYMLNDGKLITWWRGHAGLLDYSNPKAVDWWHKVRDRFVILQVL
jgi:alpha-glucosidase (family GH31 glycosyl hydrolase)